MVKAYVKIDDVKCIKDTANAILIRYDGETYWIPKSQIHEDSETYKENTEGNLIMTQWIAENKEIEGEEYEV